MKLDFSSDKPVLFVLLRAMGDVLLATPAIDAFKKAFPKIAIDVLAENIPAQPLRNNPNINNIIIAPNRGAPPSTYFPVIKQLRREAYQAVVDFQSTPGSALISRLTGASIRVGYDRRMRKWAYSKAVMPEESTRYAILQKFKLLEGFGIKPPADTDVLPRLFVTQSQLQQAEQFLQDHKITDQLPILGLAPYCRRDWRMWPIPKWQELLRKYDSKRNVIWLLFASESERVFLSGLERMEGVTVVWAGQDDLLGAAALMTKCHALVTGENGLLHLAVASSVPTFSIFCGRDEPERWIPPANAKHTALDLRGEENIMDLSDVSRSLDIFVKTLRD